MKDFKPTNPDMMTVYKALIPALRYIKVLNQKDKLIKRDGLFFLLLGFFRKHLLLFKFSFPSARVVSQSATGRAAI